MLDNLDYYLTYEIKEIKVGKMDYTDHNGNPILRLDIYVVIHDDAVAYDLNDIEVEIKGDFNDYKEDIESYIYDDLYDLFEIEKIEPTDIFVYCEME